MRKITDASGRELKKIIPSIKDVKPVGTQILIELLTPNELLNTSLHLGSDDGKAVSIDGAPQAYVLKVGPKVDPAWGISEGDRVVVSGSHTPLPEAASKNGRMVGCVEPHAVKAILIEN
jgi:hypothetical protein